MRYNYICYFIKKYVDSKIPDYGDLRDLYKVCLISDLIDLALTYEHLNNRCLFVKTFQEVKNGTDNI